MNPNCPKCGAKMTLKYNGRTSAPFWGCTDYPKCTGIKPFFENKNFGMKTYASNSRTKVMSYIRGKSQHDHIRRMEYEDDYDDFDFPGNPEDYGDSD